jgi:hypothetical protein
MSTMNHLSHWFGPFATSNVSARAWRLRRSAARRARACGARPQPSRSVEPLEHRTLLTINPVIIYDFNEGGGNRVFDSAPEGGQTDGTLVADQAPWAGDVTPQWQEGDSPAGGSHLFFPNNYGTPGPGGRIDADELLSPILGGSSSLGDYFRSNVAGQWDAPFSPGLTGADAAYPSGDDVFWGNLDERGRVRLQAGNSNAATSYEPVVSDWFAPQWHHVFQTRNADTGEVRTYVDGRLSGRAVGDTGVKGAEFRAVGATTLRQSDDSIWGYAYLQGEIDQVETYDRPVTSREVATKYGPAADAAPAAPAHVTADGGVVGGVRVSFDYVPGALGYAILRLDSVSNEYVEVATLGGSDRTPTETYPDTGLEVGRQYHYKVIAFNSAGESAPVGVDAVAGDSGIGIKGYYFDQPYWGGHPPFVADWALTGEPAQEVLAATTVNFSWGAGAPIPPFTGALQTDGFSTAFAGKLRADESGPYRFFITTDDESAVMVDGMFVAAAPWPGGPQDAPYAQEIYLEAGQSYDILVLHNEVNGDATLKLRWVTPTEINLGRWLQTPIPLENLTAEVAPPLAPEDFTAIPDGMSVHFSYTDRATNEWARFLERRPSVSDRPWETVQTGTIFSNNDGYLGPQPDLRDFESRGGSYEYRVRLENGEGTSYSNSVRVDFPDGIPQNTGAQAFYYDTRFWGSAERFGTGLPVVTDDAVYTETVAPVDFQWWYQSPAPSVFSQSSDFSTAFTGKIRTREEGVYTFLAFGDDESYLYVDGQLVSADPGTHTRRDPRTAIGQGASVIPIRLDANTEYNFVALQSQWQNEAGLSLYWIPPGQTWEEPIPYDAYTGNLPNASGGDASGARRSRRGTCK